MDIPNNLYSNLIQFPVVFLSTLVVAAVKRRWLDDDQRTKLVWRLDLVRQFAATTCAMATLVAIAVMFQGNDCLNLITLVAVDITLGTCIDVMLAKMLRVGGMRIGDYGVPACKTKAVWQTACITSVSITSRCTSAIAAICLFPFANSHMSDNIEQFEHNAIVVGVPMFYFVARFVLLDRFFRYHRGYTNVDTVNVEVETVEVSPVSKFAIELDEEEEIHPDEAASPEQPTGQGQDNDE